MNVKIIAMYVMNKIFVMNVKLGIIWKINSVRIVDTDVLNVRVKSSVMNVHKVILLKIIHAINVLQVVMYVIIVSIVLYVWMNII
jgi:hypothetical protein